MLGLSRELSFSFYLLKPFIISQIIQWNDSSRLIHWIILVNFQFFSLPRQNTLLRLNRSTRVYWKHWIPSYLWITRKDVKKPPKKVICYSEGLDKMISSLFLLSTWILFSQIFLGGKISGHRLGTWSIPPVIVDEELYRSNFPNSKWTEASGLTYSWWSGLKSLDFYNLIHAACS